VGHYLRETVTFLSGSHSSHFFELNRLKLCTTLGTVGCVAGKPPRRLHFFRHRTKLIEVLTRKTQQHRDLLGFSCSWVFRKQVVKLKGLCGYAATCTLLHNIQRNKSSRICNAGDYVYWSSDGVTDPRLLCCRVFLQRIRYVRVSNYIGRINNDRPNENELHDARQFARALLEPLTRNGRNRRID
jgi:hypothetical protein